MLKIMRKHVLQKKQALNTLRTEEYKSGKYSRGGGCMPLPVPEDAPFYIKDYSEYYKGEMLSSSKP